jgi:uncharacterized membrane protein YfcA
MTTTRKPTVKIPRRKPVLLVVGSGAVAFISTLLGIGGGAFQVQVLSAWAPMRMKRSVGTSLALITAVVTVGMIVQVITQPQDILWPEAGLMVAGALLGAPVGRWLLLIIPRQMFRYVFAVFLVVVAIRMFGLIPQATHLIGDSPVLSEPATIAFLLCAGFVAGLTSTLFGIGGGMVIVPALMLGYSTLSDDFAVARATSLIAIVPISAWATFLHALKGNLQLKVLPMLLPLCVVCAVAGVVMAYWIHADYLTIVFAVLLVVMAVKVSLERVRPVMPEDFEAKPPDQGSKAD